MAGTAGVARLGLTRHGRAWLDQARHSTAGVARLGGAWQGKVWPGLATAGAGNGSRTITHGGTNAEGSRR